MIQLFLLCCCSSSSYSSSPSPPFSFCYCCCCYCFCCCGCFRWLFGGLGALLFYALAVFRFLMFLSFFCDRLWFCVLIVALCCLFLGQLLVVVGVKRYVRSAC